MRQIVIICMILGCLGCKEASNINSLLGSWRSCEYDGSYREIKVTKDYSLIFEDNSFDSIPFISIFKNQFKDDSVIVRGVNVETFNNNREALFMEAITIDSIVLKNEWGSIDYVRLDESIPQVDSTNLKDWENKSWQAYLSRKNQFGCPDLRTEEEKEIPHLGTLEADFEELIPFGILLKVDDRMEEISYYDSTKNSNAVQQVIAYDENHKKVELIEVGEYYKKRSVYDLNSNIILSQLESPIGAIVQQYLFKYDEQNNVIEKSGFSSGEIGHTIKFIYDNEGKLKEEREYRSGELVERKIH